MRNVSELLISLLQARLDISGVVSGVRYEGGEVMLRRYGGTAVQRYAANYRRTARVGGRWVVYRQAAVGLWVVPPFRLSDSCWDT